MREGIYRIVFISMGGESGDGMVVVRNGQINGGDSCHTYQGTYHADENTGAVESSLVIARHSKPLSQVFGDAVEISLDLIGQFSSDEFEMSGHIVSSGGVTVNAYGRLLRDFVDNTAKSDDGEDD